MSSKRTFLQVFPPKSPTHFCMPHQYHSSRSPYPSWCMHTSRIWQLVNTKLTLTTYEYQTVVITNMLLSIHSWEKITAQTATVIQPFTYFPASTRVRHLPVIVHPRGLKRIFNPEILVLLKRLFLQQQQKVRESVIEYKNKYSNAKNRKHKITHTHAYKINFCTK